MIDRIHLSGERPSFLEKIDKNAVPGYEFVLEEKAKLLKACLDIAILEEMTKRNAVSAPDIIVFFEKNYDIRLSPGTVYPVLCRMERRGYIRVLPNRKKRFYVLADSGREALESLQQRLDDVQSFIIGLLNK
jgi:DNA-binding PadR family transcriptional regulator